MKNISQVQCNTCKNCAFCCYKLLIEYSLYSDAYQRLKMAYTYLICLPTTQVACEQSFSTLKYIKNKLRSKLSNENIEAHMLMSVKKNFG